MQQLVAEHSILIEWCLNHHCTKQCDASSYWHICTGLASNEAAAASTKGIPWNENFSILKPVLKSQ
jgi:hypothetical protein